MAEDPPPLNPEEEEELRREYEAAQETARRSVGSGVRIFAPSMQTLRARYDRAKRLRLQDELLGRQVAELRGETPRRAPHKNLKYYPGAQVEHAVRLKALGRGRNAIAANSGLSRYAVRLVLAHVEAGRLANAGRKGWLKVDGKISTTPSEIELHGLQHRS